MQPTSKISRENPYIVVRWKPEDVRVPIRLGGRALFIPRQFEAGIVSSLLHVVLYLEATAARNEIFDMAGQEPLKVDEEVLVMSVEVRTDRFFSFVSPEDFRRIPLKKWTTMAVAAAAATRAELTQAPADGATVEEWREKKVSFSELGPRPAGRPRMETGLMYRGKFIDLAEVRKIAAAGVPRHVLAVQERFGDPGHLVPRSTAQRWIRRARDEGAD